MEKSKKEEFLEKVRSVLEKIPVNQDNLPVLALNSCLTIEAKDFYDLLEKLRSKPLLENFGEESLKEIRRVMLKYGIKLNKNFQPIMYSVGKTK